MLIENYIPQGYKNRISRDMLMSLTHQSDRRNRKDMEDALINRSVLIVNIDDGYFRPDGSAADAAMANSYLKRELSRTVSCYERYLSIRNILANNVDGQMSLSDLGIG